MTSFATTFAAVTWYDYVKATSGESDEVIGVRLGVAGSTVNRWKDKDPNPRDVAAFAHVYGRPILEAMIQAGFLTEEDAGQQLPTTPDPRRLSNQDLLAELARRLDQPSPVVDPEQATSDRRKRQQQTAARPRRTARKS